MGTFTMAGHQPHAIRRQGDTLVLPDDLLTSQQVRHVLKAAPGARTGQSDGVSELYVPAADSPFALHTVADVILSSRELTAVCDDDLRKRLARTLLTASRAKVASSALAPPAGYRDDVLERLPAPLAERIHDYQLAAIWYVDNIAGGRAILGDDPGAGKCVAPDTPIFVNGRYLAAETLWNEYGAAGTIELDGVGAWAEPAVPLEVIAHDQEGKRVRRPITKLYRQPVDEPLHTITLADGSRITCTARHRLLTSSGWKRSDQIEPEDLVAVPRRLDWHGLPADGRIIRFLAWQIGEGHETQRRLRDGNWYGSLAITLKDRDRLERLRDDFGALTYDLGLHHQPEVRARTTYVQRDDTWCLQLGAQKWASWLHVRGYEWGHKSATKSIPEFIAAGSPDTAALFLRHFYAAEASLTGHELEITSASRTLVVQLSAMLRRFGVWLRIKEKHKAATTGLNVTRTYWTGIITGQSLIDFAKHVGIADETKQSKLDGLVADLLAVPRNPNLDVVPAADLLHDLWRATGLPAKTLGGTTGAFDGHLSGISRERSETIIAALDRVLDGTALDEYLSRPRHRWADRTVAAFERLDSALVRRTRDELARLARADVAWSRVTSATKTPYRGYVYDFSVADHHNYVAGGIVTHNTLTAHGALALRGGPTAVVCKATLKSVMEDEIRKWVSPDANVLVLDGQKAAPNGLDREAEFLIVNYEILHHRLDELVAFGLRAAVFDESQMMKSEGVADDKAREWLAMDADERKASRKKKPQGAWRTWAATQLTSSPGIDTVLLLSATPAPNGRHVEWMPQLDVLGVLDDFGGKDVFEERYTRRCIQCIEASAVWCTHSPKQKFNMKGRQVPNTFGSINPKELSDRLRSRLMVRRSQLQIMPFLDPITPVNVRVSMSKAGAVEYRRVESEFKDWLKDHAARKAREEGISIKAAIAKALRAAEGDDDVLMQLNYLRQAAAHAKMDAVIDYATDLIAEDQDTHQPRKLIVFAWNRAIQSELIEAFNPVVAAYRSRHVDDAKTRKARIAAYEQQGVPRILAATDMSREQIRESTRRFQEDPEEPVIVCSVAAAAEGHTLTAAHMTLMAQPVDTPAQVRQIAGRSYGRANDAHSIQIHTVVAVGTIEEQQLEKLDVKRAVMAATLDEGRQLEWDQPREEELTEEQMQTALLESLLDG